MIDLIKEYPKAISSLIIAVIVYYGAGKIPSELLSPEITEYVKIILTGTFTVLFGRYIRLSKTEATNYDNEK